MHTNKAVWADFPCLSYSIPLLQMLQVQKKKSRMKTSRNNSFWHSSTFCQNISGLIKYTWTGGRSWCCKPGSNQRCLQNIRVIKSSLTWSQQATKDSSSLQKCMAINILKTWQFPTVHNQLWEVSAAGSMSGICGGGWHSSEGYRCNRFW